MVDSENLDSHFEADLNAPPDQVPARPPSTTREQLLPFGELTWENFERLCYKLAGRGERVEHVTRYGRSGQSQQGIDLFVRLTTGKYETWQAKRYALIDAGDVKKAVKTFRDGTWRDRSERFILAVQAPLGDIKIQEEIETQAKALKSDGITFVPRGGEELSTLLKDQPHIVDDFFGRGWVEAFVGVDAANTLGARLDGAEFARLRGQLGRFYAARFGLLDVGVALPIAAERTPLEPFPSLLQRFVVPDVLLRERTVSSEVVPFPSDSSTPSGASDDTPAPSTDPVTPTRLRRRDSVRRASLGGWLAEGTRFVVIGEPGGGKSMFLRCVVLDLLTGQGKFDQVSQRWGQLLPIHVSFSTWSRLGAAKKRPVGLKEVLEETLQPWLTADLLSLLDRAIDERRVVLLIDGLDEWADEQAARTTLQHILAFVETHDLPMIATARPRGLDKIGIIPPNWRAAELAPLSADQQRGVADVWFSREVRAATVDPGPAVHHLIEVRRDRFFNELSRDRRLLALAGNPLLLVGLVALSIRQIALPHDRTQVIENLVKLLIETHPVQRATAAGDTTERFQYISDAQERRAALARLAFAARQASGGGSYDLKAAKNTIREYLTDANTYAYVPERAQQAASELLAVNAETIGLLVERAPGEVGFTHAVFEEHLAAEHIHSWPLQDCVAFVREQCGEPRWRSVFTSLLSQLPRASEIETLILAIEGQELSRGGVINRDVLLADIAFSGTRKPPQVSARLIQRAVDLIERGDWMPARREAIKAAIASAGEPTQPITSDGRLSAWAPRREKYLGSVLDRLGTWRPSPDLLTVLLRALHDEERPTQRGAARALSRLYRGDPAVAARLTAMRSSLNLSVTSALLEALTRGWPDTPSISAMHDAAAASRDVSLKLIGVWGRVTCGRAQPDDRDTIVGLLSESGEIEFWDRPTAQHLLSQHWPNDQEVIDVALQAVNRGRPGGVQFERESAIGYLARCSPGNSAIDDWVRRELDEEYPFAALHADVWDLLTPFAQAYPDIRARILRLVGSERGKHFLHMYQRLLIDLRGDDFRDTLIQAARDAQGFGVFWAVRPLLVGWGRADARLAALLDEIPNWNDSRLNDLASLLPQIFTDSAACRKRLLSLAGVCSHPRFDLIAQGLAALGCTAEDTEVVDCLFATLGEGAPAFDAGVALITHFSENMRVRQYALDRLKRPAPPLEVLAQVYEDDWEIRPQILACATPLPTTLRGDLVEAASEQLQNLPGLGHLLEGYDLEVDGELKIATSIAYHRRLATVSDCATEGHLKILIESLHAVGPDLTERRAAAFAGMLLLGRVADLVPMKEYSNQPMKLRTGGALRDASASLMTLICERWEEMMLAFGSDLGSRFGDYGADDGQMWESLAPHISAAPAARRDFLAFCNQTTTTLGVQGLLALAREQPASQLLLNHCWRALERPDGDRQSPWARERLRLESVYVLRDHFHEQGEVLERIRKLFDQPGGAKTADVLALVLLQPSDPLLDRISHRPIDIGCRFRDWPGATHLAGVRSDVGEFVEVVFSMINREYHDIWNFQDISNRAVIERLRRDGEAAQLITAKLESGPTENEIATLPRLLAESGFMDDHLYDLCRSLLAQEANHILPRAGYDALDDSIRGIEQGLLELIVPSFSPTATATYDSKQRLENVGLERYF